jgi:hypothetical protein
VPSEVSLTIRLKVTPEALGGDPVLVFPRLLGETEEHISFIIHSVAYRVGNFVDDVVSAINDARPYRAVGAAQSFLELAAFVNDHTKKLVKVTEASSAASRNSGPAAVLGRPGFPLRLMMAVSSRATRWPEIEVSGIEPRHSWVTSSVV